MTQGALVAERIIGLDAIGIRIGLLPPIKPDSATRAQLLNAVRMNPSNVFLHDMSKHLTEGVVVQHGVLQAPAPLMVGSQPPLPQSGKVVGIPEGNADAATSVTPPGKGNKKK